MEFDKSRVFTSLNADELRAGDKVIVAETLMGLRENVENNAPVCTIKEILGEDFAERFNVDIDWNRPLAYLMERAENCTNCEKFKTGYCIDGWDVDAQKIFRCDDYTPKTEKKAEKHYRPFKDTDELIKVWEKKSCCGHFYDGCLNLPHIWVRRKDVPKGNGMLITGFTTLLGASAVEISGELHTMEYLTENYTFLDGTPCGVVEDINTNVESITKEKMLRDAASAKSDATNTAYQGQKTFRINCTEN